MHDLGVDHQGIERDQRLGPFHTFSDTGRTLKGIGKRLAAQARYKLRHLRGQLLARLRHLAAHNGQLTLALRVFQPVVQAAAAHGIMQIARAVAGQNRHWRDLRLHHAQLRNADLVFAQVFKQESFKRLIGPVHLVDQQHGAGLRRLQCLQQGAAHQIALLIDLALHLRCALARVQVCRLHGFGRPHVQQLRCVIPFVERLALLHAVIALQPNQWPRQHGGQSPGQRRFAHARLTFQQQGTLQAQRQKCCRGQAPVCKIALLLQGLDQRINAW